MELSKFKRGIINFLAFITMLAIPVLSQIVLADDDSLKVKASSGNLVDIVGTWKSKCFFVLEEYKWRTYTYIFSSNKQITTFVGKS